MTEWLAYLPPIALLAGFALFARRRLLTYLHVFQQEEYDGPRFIKWIARNGAVDRRMTLALAALGFATPLLHGIGGINGSWIAAGFALLFFLGLAAIENDPRKAAKKKLAMTRRARRILYLAAAVLAVPAIAIAAIPLPVWSWLVAVQSIPIALVLGNLLLMPYEARVQKRFWTEAHDKLTRLAPTVIGITGSYGKTSVKHILGHMLETVAPTLITPGSVNTPMGIARVVRESLGAHHRYFIAEMGAYGPGSIARLCRLAPPDFAIITAIGHAHYERFKTLETVAEAKFELAEAAIARDGHVVVPTSLAEIGPAAARMAERPDRFIRCGAAEGCDLRILESRQTPEGILVRVVWDGVEHELRAPLFGSHHATNLALAFAAVCALGVRPEDAKLGLKRLPQIAHRLEVKPRPDGSVTLDDAYNSNPVGFKAAVETVGLLKGKHGGRGILVTPGMVELGEAHRAEHAKAGEAAAATIDVLLAVVPERIEPLIESYRGARGETAEVIRCASFAEADTWLRENRRSGDIVLLENDLPDLYERKLSL
ncbi:UDP-N-acetylmuramoyl-tripeptide--D-alanyl-D-alanine ligase [Marivibrio halodurans]|uniref:UDP-N-acetylmuramoyl-tripeptide--D-alanyl-D-alanine ligase n=1 Tax=Marivibrio halodurans TaxID=2039722 RepID=A0A8J7V1J3_9PROT|nr:UDP-N-acetylmuramoyl-tripeptide--D-alanyl-D-alanine ligase [Marivibrio halodurans]MBP5857851.1 UDP-N-acetylmuramoyl-tripeptide--D-alanyl-D-alanine ligase [Marivibrio halodurans]